mgnify:CR=1 FL=1
MILPIVLQMWSKMSESHFMEEHAEVIADHRNLMNAIERCDLAAFEPLVERHLYGGIRRLGSKLTEEYADYFEPEK